MIHVLHGKGAKDRYVPLPERTLELLRQYWATYHNPVRLFPAEGRDHKDLAHATEPMSKSSVQDAFHAALKEKISDCVAPVLEVADIFRLHGPAYREKFGD